MTEPKRDYAINGGALQMAINVLRRSGKTEVVDELEKSMLPNHVLDASLADAQAEIARLRGALEDYAALKDEVIGLRQRLQREHTMRKELEEEDFARRYNQTTYGL